MSDRKNIGILLLITLITVLTVEFLLHMLFPIRYADILDSYEYSDRLGYKFKKTFIIQNLPITIKRTLQIQ